MDLTHPMSRGGSGHHRHFKLSVVPPSRHWQASIGLGFTPSAASDLGKSGASNLLSMGNFGTIMMGTGSKLSSEERYANSTNRAASSVSGASGMQYYTLAT